MRKINLSNESKRDAEVAFGTTFHRPLLEKFVSKVYNKNLSIPTGKLGTSTEYYDCPDMYETLSVTVKSITGIDVPILVKNGGANKPVVAIIAQDPLRSERDKMLASFAPSFKNPILGTPFAIHYKQAVYPQTEVYRLIIYHILDKGFNVYITDAHKIYPSKNTPKQHRGSERSLLIDELNTINPVCIISFGSTAKDYIHDYITTPKYQGKSLELLHPSQTNWDHWKQWIFEQAYNQACSGVKTYNIDWAKYANQIACRKNMFDNQKSNMHVIISNIVNEIFDKM